MPVYDRNRCPRFSDRFLINLKAVTIMGATTLKIYEDPTAFAERVTPYLLRDEAVHNLFFGILDVLRRRPERYPNDNLLACVERDGQVTGVCFRTPPHALALSVFENLEDVAFIADAAHERYDAIPSVSGTPPVVEAFLDVWQRRTASRATLESGNRIYELSRVIPVADVPGELRRATLADRELLLSWTVDFMVEAMGDSVVDAAQEAPVIVDEAVDNDVFFWEVDGLPVSMAGARGPTPNGIRISYVYTPPEQRRNGYASACVAEISQKMLDSGREFCFLFTDLSNPTSNHIYQEIGYEPVCDVHVYEFTDAAVAPD